MAKVGRNGLCSCGSGRKSKHCCGLVAVAPVQADDATLRAVFLGEGEEPLTDQVIDSLAAVGWNRADLLAAQAAGASYSSSRSSLLYPPEFFGPLFGKGF